MSSRLALVDTSAFIEADHRPSSPLAGAVIAAIDDGRAARGARCRWPTG